MASLPASSVCQVKPFLASGVDYAGLIPITEVRTRKPFILEAYICIFVCFATKAVHLDLASDLSSEIFLPAFRHFIACSVPCTHLHCDCGPNFVGSNRQLSKLQEFLADNKCLTDKQVEDKMT
ncbi:hypothetical protein PR048_006132 [Dryococelus australis]|uniref:Integrase catalytic domain-containing protein n=1 Tax=Dryococelus australis TaxID=614101 RepID=A0ABQ9IA51_9NEOP|nr:hypothetical protein PR048_006132 [Dryococelus australis]